MIRSLYRLATIAGRPGIEWYLGRRRMRGKEHPERFGERKGIASRPRPPGTLIWLHGASVGEAMALLPLMDRLSTRPGLSLLLTTGTVTSARLLEGRLPSNACHQFVPVDNPAWVTAFLDHWQPDLALWSESDFWPNLLAETKARHIPAILVQGRVSARSFSRWRLAPWFIKSLLDCFDRCLAQTPTDADRLRQLGARDVTCVGNLKLAVPPLPCDADDLISLGTAIGDRPVWLAASTHPGEEAIAARVHLALREDFPRLLTIIAPRHPPRASSVAQDLRALGLAVALRSRDRLPTSSSDIYLVDTIGELGLLFRRAPLVFMGKSLTAEGGQNPFEPARLGAAILFGPRMSNFPDMAQALLASGGAREVADEAGLTATVRQLLHHPGFLTRQGAQARAWAEREAGLIEGFVAALEPAIAQAERRHARP